MNRLWKPLEESPELGYRPLHSQFPQRALLFGLVGFGNQRVQLPLFRIRFNPPVPLLPVQLAEPLSESSVFGLGKGQNRLLKRSDIRRLPSSSLSRRLKQGAPRLIID